MSSADLPHGELGHNVKVPGSWYDYHGNNSIAVSRTPRPSAVTLGQGAENSRLNEDLRSKSKRHATLGQSEGAGLVLNHAVLSCPQLGKLASSFSPHWALAWPEGVKVPVTVSIYLGQTLFFSQSRLEGSVCYSSLQINRSRVVSPWARRSSMILEVEWIYPRAGDRICKAMDGSPDTNDVDDGSDHIVVNESSHEALGTQRRLAFGPAAECADCVSAMA